MIQLPDQVKSATAASYPLLPDLRAAGANIAGQNVRIRNPGVL